MKYDELVKEATKEAKNKKRDYLSVQRRVFIVKALRDKFKMSFMSIAVILNKDLSTIKSIYDKSN
jgi:hypothetical protein